MITAELRGEMRRLVLVEGWKIETVARKFGVHHSVVRRALRTSAPVEKVAQASGLDPFKPYIVKRLTERPELTSLRLLRELRERGYPLGICPLRRYVAKVRAPRPRKAYLRFEVEPGEQAQVDWGSFGHIRVGGTQRPLSVFSMVLSWSRALYIDFSLDQQMETFLRMHQRALAYFGGVPRRILYDNLKSVVLHHVGSVVQFNPRFLAFAGHYLFEPVAAPVRYPEAKGRVESSIKYVRQSFFYGRSFSSIDDIRAQAAQWRDRVANERIHRTTNERPSDRLLVERVRLRALPEHAFDSDLCVHAIVSKDARVRLDTNSYSVPIEQVGQRVTLRADDGRVRILDEAGNIVAEHARSFDRRKAIEDPAHIQSLLDKRTQAQGPKRRDRIESLGPECRLYLQEVARSRIDLEAEIKKLLSLVEQYGEADVAAGMAQALVRRSLGARYVRALVDQARFARGLGEPPTPIVTGNPVADAITVEPHNLEGYDALFEKSPKTRAPSPKPDDLG